MTKLVGVDLQRVRLEWYAKAEEGGVFTDLESPRNPDGPLSDRGNPDAPTIGRKAAGAERVYLTAGEVATLADFYAAAGRMLHDRAWRCEAERSVWALYCEGASTHRIARRLGSLRFQARHGGRRSVDLVSITALLRSLRAELLGQRRRRGRPRKVGGYGKDALQLNVRFDEQEQAALHAIMARTGLSRRLAVRAALLLAARS